MPAGYLPVAYGYATTVRRAQGTTLLRGCVLFDSNATGRGYAYVMVSRFKSRAGVFHCGFVRRSDWLPVGAPKPGQQEERSAESEDDGKEAVGVSGLRNDESEDEFMNDLMRSGVSDVPGEPLDLSSFEASIFQCPHDTGSAGVPAAPSRVPGVDADENAAAPAPSGPPLSFFAEEDSAVLDEDAFACLS